MTAKILGLGGYLPKNILTNADISKYLDTSPEWIESRTGIKERRVVSKGQSTKDLAVLAGKAALKSARVAKIDSVIVVTTSPDRLCPAVAPEVAHELGLGHIAAYDMTSACSGFVYGVAAACGQIASGIAETVLLICAEAFTTVVNPKDRVTHPIFGDGAGAVVLRRCDATDPHAILGFDLGADGGLADLLAIPAGGSRQRSQSGIQFDQVKESDWFLQMEGRAIFNQAVLRMTESAKKMTQKVGWSVLDVDWFVGHQANYRIIENVANEMGLDPKKVASNISHVGNTLAASIPLLLIDSIVEGKIKAGDKVLISAFGAGLSWGSTAMIWPEIDILDSLHSF